MIKFKKVICTMLCFFTCLATIPLTSIIAEAKLYPEPDVRVVSAGLDSSGKYIKVDYYLNSDFYSDRSTGTFFSIGYTFTDEQLNRIYKNQFVGINKPKGRYVAKIPYPAGVVARVTISTHYATRAISPYGSGGINNYKEKIKLLAAPTGKQVSPPRVVTKGEAGAGLVLLKAPGIILYFASQTPLVKLTGTAWTLFGEYQDIDAAFGLNTMPPALSAGQCIQTTTWYKNYRMYENIKVWSGIDSYNKNETPIYDGTGFIGTDSIYVY